MTQDPQTALQERLAHLERLADDLSETVARQAREIDRLTHRVAMLMEREAARDALVALKQETAADSPAQMMAVDHLQHGERLALSARRCQS